MVLVVIVNLITIGCTFLIGFKLGVMQAIITILEYLNPIESFVQSKIVGDVLSRNIDSMNNGERRNRIKHLLNSFAVGWIIDGMCSTDSLESDKEGSDAG